MATFKSVVLPSYKRKDGTYNVKIRITHKRVVRYVPTPFYVTSEQLTRGFRIKDTSILDRLDEKIKELRRNADKLGFMADGLDADHFVKIITSKGDSMNFLEYMERYISSMGVARARTQNIYRTAYNSLCRYVDNKTLPFSFINKLFMLKYWESISNLKPNTKRSYIICIKTVYKQAQKELNDDDAGIIVAKHGVFDLINIPPMEKRTDYSFDTIEQMQSVIDSPYTGYWLYDFAKDLFIFSFVCFGMNYADMIRLKKDQYNDGIITYRRKKVEDKMKDEAEQKVQVPEVAKIIIEKYDGDKEFLLDFNGHVRSKDVARAIHSTFQSAGVEKKTDSWIGRAGHIKGKYVFYTARHTMATFARNICHVDKMTVHEMLNHATPPELKTTDVYLRKDYSNIWEANQKLLALFDWGFYIKQKKAEPVKALPMETDV